MSKTKLYTSGGFVDPTAIKVYGPGGWTDVSFVKVFTGTGWQQVWPSTSGTGIPSFKVYNDKDGTTTIPSPTGIYNAVWSMAGPSGSPTGMNISLNSTYDYGEGGVVAAIDLDDVFTNEVLGSTDYDVWLGTTYSMTFTGPSAISLGTYYDSSGWQSGTVSDTYDLINVSKYPSGWEVYTSPYPVLIAFIPFNYLKTKSSGTYAYSGTVTLAGTAYTVLTPDPWTINLTVS